MTGYVVFTLACLLTAVALPVGYAWYRLRHWRYPRPEDTVPSSEPVGPLPTEAVQLWSAHDPTSLGFVHLGDLRAGPALGKDALTRFWVDAPTRTTVATVTFIPGQNGRPSGRRRGFFTLHGDIAEPDSLQVAARSSALLHHLVRPGSQVLYWPAADQLELLRVHRRLLGLVSPGSLPVSSLEELRQLVARANDTHPAGLSAQGSCVRKRTAG